ncbi:autotransporter domain-containing protein [Sphingomonas morindae]|uniref:Autotransporter domain-containing protein n=1 Tax=Sphingomonas morindae TaxID=1541170 RepID=A0ABY4X8A8_9SPHN|nr:autotransporter domain-containing protein [Sphingomonas morindae]USI73149.1 autotransporter domain-containing protein [Sphingomonas morindae]
MRCNRILCGLLAASALGGAPALAAGNPGFTGVTAFGDSLSDSGNVARLSGSPVPLRFTTNPGLTTVEAVAAAYGLPLSASLTGGTNFAYGGAGVVTNSPGTPAIVPTVSQQVSAYLAANARVDGGRLYSLWGGANDIFYHATAVAAAQTATRLIAAATAGQSAAQAAATGAAIQAQVARAAGVTALEDPIAAGLAINAAASQEVTLLGQLQAAGARTILVFNLPDLGLTPQARAQDAASPGTAAVLTNYAKGYNTVLSDGLSGLGRGIVPVNTFALISEAVANPAAFGLTNVTVPACTTASSISCTPATLRAADAATTYLFADGVHPTAQGHALIAQLVESEFTAAQEASLLAEQPLGLLDEQRSALRRQMLVRQQAPAAGTHLFVTGTLLRPHYDAQAVRPAAHDEGSATIGVDHALSPDLTIGAAFTLGLARQTRDEGQFHRLRNDTYLGALFGQYQRGNAYVIASIGYGGITYTDIERRFQLGPTLRTEQGETWGRTVSANATAGYWFGGEGLRAGPFVGIAYDRVHIHGYGEQSGDSSAMRFGSQTREQLLGEAGLRLQGTIQGGVPLHPYAEIGYAYDGRADRRAVETGLTTMGGSFSLPGYRPDRQWATAEAGLSAQLASRLTAYAGYQGRFAGRASSAHGGTVGLSFGL